MMTNLQAAMIAAAIAYGDVHDDVPALAREWAEALDQMDAERAEHDETEIKLFTREPFDEVDDTDDPVEDDPSDTHRRY